MSIGAVIFYIVISVLVFLTIKYNNKIKSEIVVKFGIGGLIIMWIVFYIFYINNQVN